MHRSKTTLLRRMAAAFTATVCVFAIMPAAASATSVAVSAEEEIPPSPTIAVDDSPTTLRIATSGFVDSFNPFTSIYLTPTNAIRYMYENLVQFDAEDGSPTGGLAEEWETNDDGSVWTYTLREGLVWSDGQPLTSEDVKWTLDQMMEVPAMGTANGGLVASFDSVEAPDERTVIINLTEPQAPNPGAEIPIVPKHIWEAIDNPTEYPNDSEVVGSGPFLLESYSQNQSFELVSNPNFWRGAPSIDRIQYVYYTNSDAMVQALRAGEIDFVTGLTPTQFDALEGTENIATLSGIGRRYTSIAINPGHQTRDGEPFGQNHPALEELEVRQAIRQGIDIQTLFEQVLDSQGVIGTSFVPASFPDWHLRDDHPSIMGFDPEAARAQLDEAGWVEGSDGIREKDGVRLTISLFVDASSPTEQSSAEFLAPWMSDIGIELAIQSTDTDTISDSVGKGEYDMYFTGWSLNPDPDYQLGINTCMNLPTETDGTGGTSQDAYCDPQFDEMYMQQHTELDLDARKQIVEDMLAMHYEASTSVVLWYGNSLEAYRSDRFEGWTLMPTDGGIIANQAGYWGFLTAEPVGEEGSASSGNTGASTGLLIAGGVVAILVIGGLIFWFVRRKNAADVE